MASINSIMGGGSSSSVYGNRNILSGLASGMDTESMIENAISGYKMKLSLLQQQRTVVEWKQSAYRNIIDKMVAFDRKYTSYSSGNNLLSAGFFDNATKIITGGENASKIVASGKTSSQIEINSVTQLASAARYAVDTSTLKPSQIATDSFFVKGPESEASVGTLSGSLTLGYGGKRIHISFDEKDIFNTADEMAKAINKKLEDQVISFDGGTQAKGSERIKAVVKDLEGGGQEIGFELVKENDGNGVWIESADNSIEKALGIKTEGDDQALKNFQFDSSKVVEKKSMVDTLKESGFSITLDGRTVQIQGPSLEELKSEIGPDGKPVGDAWNQDTYMSVLQKKIDQEFGAGKLTVSNAAEGADLQNGKIRLEFSAANNGKFSITSKAGKQIGMENALTSYVNTYNTLGSLSKNMDWNQWRMEVSASNVTETEGKLKDKDGNFVIKDESDPNNIRYFKADEDGNALYDFKINDKSVGTFTEKSSLKSVMDAINNHKDSDVTVSYSEFTGKFSFTAKESGAQGKIQFGDGLASALFGGGNLKEGTDAEFSVTVNNETKTVTRSNNTTEIDGLKITLKGEFQEGTEAVTFTSQSDADKIVNVVKDMVKDYNEMAKLIKDSYSTMPQTNSKGKPYMPLTDKDRKDMSESEIKAYEDKAKQGILFADRDLAGVYNGLQNSLHALGASGSDFDKIGLTTSFEGGFTTIAFNEEELRKALEQDPEKVKDIFTRSKENGASSDGLMVGMKHQLDKYVRTTGAVKGLLIEKAGSTQAPTSVLKNEFQKKLGNYDKQIATWQTKLGDKIDYYNHKFTVLEQMIAEMNNQSGMLMGFGGGY